MASDVLSDVFRANVEAIRERRGLNLYQFGKIVTPNDPTQARTQITRGLGFTLSTVERWAERLGVDPLELLTPAGEGQCQRCGAIAHLPNDDLCGPCLTQLGWDREVDCA